MSTRTDPPTLTGPASYPDAQRQAGRSADLTYEAVWRLVEAELGGTALDAGCGAGYWLSRLAQSGRLRRVVGLDIRDDGASGLAGAEFEQADLSRASLPFEAGELDWVFAIELLEHLANPRHLVNEAARCLQPGGRLVVTTPCNESLRAKAVFVLKGYFPDFCAAEYHGNGHITPLLEIDLRRMASEAGFRRIEFFWPVPGRIPKTRARRWPEVLPLAKGKLWSDTLFAILTR